MKAVLTEKAQQDLREEIQKWGSAQSLSGHTFKQAYNESLQEVLSVACKPDIQMGKFRRMRMDNLGYPFGILWCKREKDTVLITAVMHVRRHEVFWRDRMKDNPKLW